jgi:hypothetical protein
MIILLCCLLGASGKQFTDGGGEKKKCASYMCGRVSPAICREKGANSYFVASCSRGEYCGLKGICERGKEKYREAEVYPGEKCVEGAKCRTGMCVDDVCRGKKLGEKCEMTLECEAGLRCHHTCKELFIAGERGCRSDYDCSYSQGCNFGECTEMFSLKPYSRVGKCEDFTNLLCDSAMCDKGKCIEDQYLGDFPKECEADKECKSNGGYYSSCECGINEKGKSFCLAFPADVVGKDFYRLLGRWVKSKSIQNCNSERRFSLQCMLSNWDACSVLEFLYKDYRFRSFPNIIDNPICVEQSLTQDYWEIREAYFEGLEERMCEFPFK